jgi:hypothetical protein
MFFSTVFLYKVLLDKENDNSLPLVSLFYQFDGFLASDMLNGKLYYSHVIYAFFYLGS